MKIEIRVETFGGKEAAAARRVGECASSDLANASACSRTCGTSGRCSAAPSRSKSRLGTEPDRRREDAEPPRRDR